MAASPTSRTLAECKKQGLEAGVVERYNSFTKRRHDLFGFIDIVAIDAGGLHTRKTGNKLEHLDGRTIGIQATSASNKSAHRQKILDEPLAKVWLLAGNEIKLWTWGKKKVKRGGKAYRWHLTITTITLEDFE